ncbi:hypothetical protein LMH87_010897 [Akanthomyces muscarius]|uniref:Uncharacterized protein n=1 Tax=Akanthomyces muscarius TaxID=2231603 RepID=A0A9W8Q842_AKAMU|nr:hypothetical protein LMH87_010897 [Akanthomyces muscarius]KAJ4150132.1 hypothetical protein LMH87_010897 [Akanthomyces muscarius]
MSELAAVAHRVPSRGGVVFGAKSGDDCGRAGCCRHARHVAACLSPAEIAADSATFGAKSRRSIDSKE